MSRPTAAGAMSLALALAVLLPGSRAGATADLGRLAVGDSVRVRTATGARLRGVVVPSDDGTLVVAAADGLHRLAVDELVRVQRRGRATRRGASIGGLAGGIGGAILGWTFAAGISDNGGDGDFMVGLLTGAVGLAGGLLAGGVTGAAFPAWHDVDLRGDLSPGRRGRRGGPRHASGCLALELLGAFAPADENSFGPRLGLAARVSSFQTVGLEVGWLAAMLPAYDDPALHRDGEDDPVFWGGLTGETNLSRGRLRPLLAYGIGLYNWDEGYLGYHVGGGVSWRLGGGRSLRLLYRHHDHLTSPHWSAPRLDIVQAGVSWSW